VLRTLHAPKVHEGIVGLPPLDQPSVPIVAPFATRPQSRWQARTTSFIIAATIVFVAIEVPAGVSWKLAGTTICEDPLPSARDLKIETVVAVDIIAYVCDLDDHALAREVRMRPAPVPRLVDFSQKHQFEALAAISVPGETMITTDSSCCETHAQALSDREWFVIRTRCSFATATTN